MHFTEKPNTSANHRESARIRKAQKPIGSFPRVLFRLIEHFAKGEEANDIEITMDSPAEAQALRFRWYDFKKALRGQRPDDASIAETILCQVKENVLKFSHRDLQEWSIRAEEQVLAQMQMTSGASTIAQLASPADSLDFPTSTLDASEAAALEFLGKKPSSAQPPAESTEHLSVEELMKREMGIED